MDAETAMSIRTPLTHPEHETVGHFFVGFPSMAYFCDSYDPRIGFWMTPIGPLNPEEDLVKERSNVSERAIDRTFHRVHEYGRHDLATVTRVAAIAKQKMVPQYADDALLDWACRNGWEIKDGELVHPSGYTRELKQVLQPYIVLEIITQMVRTDKAEPK